VSTAPLTAQPAEGGDRPAAANHAGPVPRTAVALVVLGGAIWLFAGVAYGATVAACSTCASWVVADGVDTSTFSPAAVQNLAWADLYATLYIATFGLLAIVIGLTAFRRGEGWSWVAIAIMLLAFLLTAVIDQLAWGGWYTFLGLGVVPLLGLARSAPSFLGGFRAGRRPHG
jgi:hypothetical protein